MFGNSLQLMSRAIWKPNNRFAIKINWLVSTRDKSSSKVISEQVVIRIKTKTNSRIIKPNNDRQSRVNCEIIKINFFSANSVW